MTVQNSDQFLVNRSSNSYQVEAQNLMATIQDDDLMLVNRSGQSYKVTGAEVKESLIPGLTLTAEISPLIAETGDTLTAFGSAAGGVEPYSYAYQWYQKLGVIVGTTAIAGATESTYTIPSDRVGWTFSCEVTVTDSAGTAVSEFSPATQPITESASIVTPIIIAPPDGAGTGGDETYTPKTSPIDSIDDSGSNPDWINRTTCKDVNGNAVSTTPENIVKAFNGVHTQPMSDLSTNGTITVDATGLGLGGVVRIMSTAVSGGLADYQYRVNTAGWVSDPGLDGDGNQQWFVIGDLPSITTIEARGINNGVVRLYGIEVAGKELIDSSIAPGDLTLTLTDSSTYNADTDEDMGQPISETFSAGQVVTSTTSSGDTASGVVSSVSGNSMSVEPNTAYDWTKFIGTGSGYRSIAYGNGRFIAVCYQGSTLTSTDGYNWVELDTGVTTGATITYQQGRFIIPAGGSYATSETGDPGTWTTHYINSANAQFYQMLFVMPASGAYRTSGVWLGTGGQNTTTNTSVWYNPSLLDSNGWKECTGTAYSTPGGNTATPRMKGIATADGRVACMDTSYTTAYTTGMWWSDDGINFTEGSSTSSSSPNGYGYQCIATGQYNGATRWVILINYGDLLYSADGANWTYKTGIFVDDPSVDYAPYNQVIYQNNKWTAVGYGAYNTNSHTVISSPDGINWKDVSGQSPPTATDSSNGIAFSSSAAVVVTGSNTTTSFIFTSAVFGADFEVGSEVVNSVQATQYAPDPETLVFVANEPKDSPVGSIQTWGNATWQVSTDEDFTSPITSNVSITDPNTEQTTSAAAFNLEGDTTYWVRVRYGSTKPGAAIDSLYSEKNRFKTRDNSVNVDDIFIIDTYSATGGSELRNAGTDYTNGGLLWAKTLTGSYNHGLMHYQSNTDYLSSNKADGSKSSCYLGKCEATLTSNGVQLDDTYSGMFNQPSQDYVSWSFLKSPGFFDVVEYDGNGTVQNVPHNLTSKPGCMFIKCLDEAYAWYVYHQNAENNKGAPAEQVYSVLNTDVNFGADPGAWNNTNPTDSVFTVGNTINVNENGKDYVAYLFADTEGLVKCGGYSGSSGTISIDCGFEPQWLMIKNTTSNAPWVIFDSKRGTGVTLYANEASGQTNFIGWGNFTETGFDLFGTANYSATCTNGNDYVFIAIAKGGATRFFDAGAFKTMTDREVTGKYGVDPYTANLEPLNIKELTHEPVGVTAGFAEVRGSNKLRPIQELANLVRELERQETINEVKLDVVKERNRILRQYMVDDMIAEAQALIEQWAAEDAAAATQEVDLEEDES